MTAHTLYPKSEQYITVCQKLIEKYPKLMDPDNDTSCVKFLNELRKLCFHALYIMIMRKCYEAQNMFIYLGEAMLTQGSQWSHLLND